MNRSTETKYSIFKALHMRSGAFVMPNAWDAGSARILTSLGFEAIATTSAGLAYSLGRRNYVQALTRDQVMVNARSIAQATELPVSADLEAGYGASPEACAETVKAAISKGLVGGSIEDATGVLSDPVFDFELAVERVAAVCEAVAGLPFLVTARAENFLCGRADLDDTIARLQAFSTAGADVLYAPGLTSLDQIRLLCNAVDKPVNVVMGLGGFHAPVGALQQAGVRRVSVGGSFARAALGALIRAAQEVKHGGTFTYADKAVSDSDAAAYMSAEKRSIR